MKKKRTKKSKLPILLIDNILLIISFFSAFFIRFGEIFNHRSVFFNDYLQIGIFMIIIWSVTSLTLKNFSQMHEKPLGSQIRRLIISKGSFLFLITLYIVVVKGHFISRKFFAIFICVDFFLIFLFYTLRYYRLSGTRRVPKKVLLIGEADAEQDFAGNLNYFSTESGYKIEKNIRSDAKNLLKNITGEVQSRQYDLLLISNPLKLGNTLQPIINTAENKGLRVSICPGFIRSLNSKIGISYIDGKPFINVRNEPLQYKHNRIIKRIFDLSVSLSVFLLFYWWLYLIFGLIIKLSSKGPVLFKQKRGGINQVEFTCYKFRTMKISGKQDHALAITKKNDPRITGFGRYLRKTSLDELPQIINVLKGNMSLVGPRPHMLKEDLEVREKVPQYMVRHFVKPGITGWAAVNGYRGGTRNMELMKKRIDYDLQYIEFWSFWFDLKIILKTAWQLITFNISNVY